MDKDIEKIDSAFDSSEIFAVDNSFDSERFIKVRLKLLHTVANKKGSNFTLDAVKDAEKTLSNIPILANVVNKNTKKQDFGSHDTHIEVDYNGRKRLIYDEVPIGLIPTESNYELKKEGSRHYVYVDGYIWKGYSNYAEDIVKDRKKFALSIETRFKETNYNSKTKQVDVKKFIYKGVTLLGKNINPGMYNAGGNIEANDENFDDVSYKEQMLVIMEQLKDVIESFNKHIDKEGGKDLEEENKFDENMEENVVQEDNAENKPSVEQTLEDDFSDDKQPDVKETKNVANKDDESEEDFEDTYDKKIKKARKSIRSLNKVEVGYHYYFDMSDEYIYYSHEYNQDGEWNMDIYRAEYSIDENDNIIVNLDTKTEMVYTLLTKDEFDKLQTEKKKNAEEFAELKAFKEEKLKEEFCVSANNIFSRFDDVLSENEKYKELKKNFYNFSIDQIEKDCFALYGQMNFSQKKDLVPGNTSKFVEMDMNFDQEEKEIKSSAPYADVLNKYYEG